MPSQVEVHSMLHRALVKDLKQLRKGGGMESTGLAEVPRLVQLLAPGSLSEASRRVVEAVRTVVEDGTKSSRALKNALALDDRVGLDMNLEQRRQRLVPGEFGSLRTLTRAEDSGFGRLAELLATTITPDPLDLEDDDDLDIVDENDPPTTRRLLVELLNDVGQLQQKIAQALIDLE